MRLLIVGVCKNLHWLRLPEMFFPFCPIEVRQSRAERRGRSRLPTGPPKKKKRCSEKESSMRKLHCLVSMLLVGSFWFGSEDPDLFDKAPGSVSVSWGD